MAEGEKSTDVSRRSEDRLGWRMVVSLMVIENVK